jgi:putative tricarboxylic transport membrane protein
MVRPDRLVALCILAFSIGYGMLALDYQLLPFEQRMPFKPNTMPIGLAALGIFFSLAVILFPGGASSGLASDADGWKDFDWMRTWGLVALMVVYAMLLRPAGYVVATTGFLAGGAILLGERRYVVLLPVALIGAFGTWYLVDSVLGIYMKPWPAVGG